MASQSPASSAARRRGVRNFPARRSATAHCCAVTFGVFIKSEARAQHAQEIRPAATQCPHQLLIVIRCGRASMLRSPHDIHIATARRFCEMLRQERRATRERKPTAVFFILRMDYTCRPVYHRDCSAQYRDIHTTVKQDWQWSPSKSGMQTATSAYLSRHMETDPPVQTAESSVA